MVDRPWTLIGLLFFAMLALGIPLIWMKLRFFDAGQTAATITICIYTALVFWGFWWVISWCYQRVMDSL